MTVERRGNNGRVRPGRTAEVPGRTAAPYAIIPPMLPQLRPIFPQLSLSRRAALNFLTARSGLIVCLLFLLVGLDTAGDYGLLYDEQPQIVIATANLNYIRGQAESLERLPYPFFLYGVAFELPLLLAQEALGWDALSVEDYHYIHRLRLTLTHLFFVLGGWFCYRLAYRLFDNRLLAILALLFYLLHPRLYAHSFINSKDLPFVSMLALALYLLERAFRRDTLGAFVLLGIGVGILTNLRIMGLMLLAAPLVMRGLDLLYAQTGPERKHILLTGGMFALTAALTLYVVTPYAWTNPVDYLTASLALSVDHPAVLPQLFQGQVILSDAIPPHYAATWFGITTPPPLLLLGGGGIAAVLALGITRPGAVFRNNRLRFYLLLLACFLLPPLAAALLGANQYEGWRHFYFVYVPFVLLAAGGLQWLMAALSRRRLWPAGIYGLTGLALGLILLQMAQIHPLQHIYFNFLVDRTTPERLRTQYEMDRWLLARRAAVEYLRQSHPGETLSLRADPWAMKILPPASRRQVQITSGGRNADYELTLPDSTRPDLAFNSRYGRFYNNTLVVLRPLDSARMTPAALAAYQEIYRQALAAAPIIRADYNVYRQGQRLVFVKENCPRDGGDAWFDVKLFPNDLETLPPDFRDNRAYAAFANNRVRLDNLCLAVIQLPDDATGDLILRQRRVGNYGPAGAPVWEELYSLSRPGLGELIADYRRKPAAANPDAFAVFIDRDGGRHRLLYAKADCAPSESETPITLHIYPENLSDLPFYLWQSGLDNRDFSLWAYGGRPGGECIAVVPLPDYPIAEIRTGQAGSWEVNLYPPAEPDYLRETYAALSDQQPNARSDFDLYLQDNRLIYLRETCAADDTAAGFFLHILPEDIADLPAERQDAGFANMDFAFDRRGGSFDGKCMAVIFLPPYPIKSLRTGQHIPGPGEVWAAELAVGR